MASFIYGSAGLDLRAFCPEEKHTYVCPGIASWRQIASIFVKSLVILGFKRQEVMSNGKDG